MIGIVKMAALGAVLSYGVAAAYDLPARKLETAVSSKYQDRIPASHDAPLAATRNIEQPTAVATGSTGKGDRLVVRQEQAAAPLITIENRVGESTSILVRQPQTIVAQR